MRSARSDRVRRFSVWLVPSPGSRRDLRPLRQACAHRTAGGRFAPHLTLASGSGPVAAVRRAVAALAATAPPVVLAVRGVRIGSSWFRSVYLEVAADASLRALRRRLRTASGVPLRAPPRPHVSLAYGVPPAERRALAARVAASGHPAALTFDAVVVARPGRRGWRRVAGWRIGRPAPLAAGRA